MEYLIPSFLAGVLTMLAPCTITLLPVILGGSVGEKHPLRPLIISLSLGVSIILFTLLLKATTVLIDIPQYVWQTISGGIIFVFGIIMLFPTIWDRLAIKLKLYKSEKLLAKSGEKKGLKGAILLGASLGPVFSTCSPTYLLILAIVLPESFSIGLLNLIVYSLGLIIPLTIIGYGGQKIAARFKPAANPNGWFKKLLGILLIITGTLILTGYDKKLETFILDSGYLGPIKIENSIIDQFE